MSASAHETLDMPMPMHTHTHTHMPMPMPMHMHMHLLCQASSNYGMQCSHIDQMKKGQPAMEWKVTAALGEQWFPVDLGDNGSLHPPLAGMLIYDAFRSAHTQTVPTMPPHLTM